MISLKEYRSYWDQIGNLIDIPQVLAITIDKEMTKRLQTIKRGETVLFWLPPAAKSETASVDAYSERNSCIIFVMEKYDPQREGSLEVLERTQPVVERLKEQMIEDSRICNPVIKVDITSIDTLPETDFYGTLAGWSIGFRVITDN